MLSLVPQLPTPPPLEQPINLFNIGGYVGQVLAIVQGIKLNSDASRQAEASLLASDTTMIANQKGLSAQIASLETLALALATALDNATALLMIAIEGLGDVATADLQQQEIVLLRKIWQTVSGQAVSQGIDFADIWATRSPNPPQSPGP